ncbi:2-oxoacid:ferredoxin oxidoreductase subunit beta [archaeon]|jgi:2-oxoglutarate/2-oxoacid ferredoxin oxidoreductase subunit beta|nr:2-oxoacid:ferredoxin oxidoreductase subunit beta [archaeon]MBT3451333.1 2-oxoacid:ferredoxin oxidoreductase subunit beta [archaeon]MBT6869351.1 2-oxoacid:ferredoxin oxidoreductase subunit beta [archaeon]MBT7192514.1 2-oxoacid:ferredoxin oxidoreductase subunit beta [archaeon]MBT7380590.1 2-oxoacid:ferredoxin oxidoreductase subunit beta [archaeon]
MVELQSFNKNEKPSWCPGCGNFAISLATKKSISELNIKPKDSVLVSGVGCFAKLPYWIKSYGFVGLHGRSLPVAQGTKLANKKLTVIAYGGDGDGYGEGGNHFIHACRRNVNITYLVHNNSVFGLTTGQYSPTSKQGKVSKSSPLGAKESPLNPIALAISSGAKFVARGYAGDINHLTGLIKKAIQFEGFAFIDILQYCPSFGHDIKYYNERVYRLEDNFHDSSNKILALQKAFEIEENKNDRLAIGVFYKSQ